MRIGQAIKQRRWRAFPSIDFRLPLAEIDAAVRGDEGAKSDRGLIIGLELGDVEHVAPMIFPGEFARLPPRRVLER